MSVEDNETIADIIAEMRFHGQQNIDAEKDKPEYGFLTVEGRSIQSYADRLEAAHKREIEDAERRGNHAATKAICETIEKVRPLYDAESVGDSAKLRKAISTLRTALKEIRNDVLDMVMNYKSEDPDSYAHGLCLSIGGACDMVLNSTKEFDNAD